MTTHARTSGFSPALVRSAALDALAKLHPARMIKNPVMFVVEVGSAFTTVLFVHALATGAGDAPAGFILAVSLWLWFTVIFANFAEAMAEGRGKAQADALRRARQDVVASRLRGATPEVHQQLVANPSLREQLLEPVSSSSLKVGDVVLVSAGELIPADGEVTEGVASVDESAITGESAPVIRESGGDCSAVTGGTRGAVRLAGDPRHQQPGRHLPRPDDRHGGGRERHKTPNEIALDILLAALTIVFLLATVTLLPFSRYAVASSGRGSRSR